MAMPEMEQVKDAALKYDKPTLARLAQSGQLSPTLAVMAGMMRDRIVQSEMKPPAPPTVAQEVMQPMGQRMGLAAAAQPQQPQQQGQGLNQVPVPPQMFERQGMAGGGIVAFQAGGSPSERIRREFESLPVYKAETEGIPGAELFSFMGREMRGDVRIDPETGKPVSFGEYLRLKDEREARAAQQKGLGAVAATTPSTTQTAVKQAAVEDPMRGQTDVGYIPPEVFAADQKEAQARNAAALAAAREAAPAPTRQPVAPPQAAAPTQTAEAKPFDIGAEAKRVADARKAFLGEDPYTKYLTEQLEKGGEEQFTDRALRALQMIQAGEQIREGRAGAETALPTLLQQREKDIARKEARAEKLAQLKGREYEGRAKAFEAAYGKGEELAKEERAAKRKEKELKEARAFERDVLERKLTVQKEIAGMKPETASKYIGELLRSKDPKDREVGKILAGRSKTGEMSRAQAAEIAIRNNPILIQPGKEAELEAAITRILGLTAGGGMGGGDVDMSNPLLQGS